MIIKHIKKYRYWIALVMPVPLWLAMVKVVEAWARYCCLHCTRPIELKKYCGKDAYPEVLGWVGFVLILGIPFYTPLIFLILTRKKKLKKNQK